ncbi:MAG: hypothetical protein JWO70_4732 [Betaproteobacteria bacterium]|jgi:hypothetical protein|nr:hypothetical protein [Betaproteobacteria bacterium]
MAVEISPAPDRARLSSISWPAIFASLAVGISVMLLLTLAGVAVGVSVVDTGADSPRAITMGAAVWQTISMLVAAIVGGYVAARLSGLRRTGDGVLHGAVSWGATTVLYAALATTALGTLTAGMFGLLAPSGSEHASATAVPGDRDQAQRTLESMGMSPDQARTIVDRLNAPAAGTGTNASASATRQQVEEAADTVGTATGWLSATVLLSLVLSMIGGAMGARGVRRTNRRLENRESPAPSMTATQGISRRHASDPA